MMKAGQPARANSAPSAISGSLPVGEQLYRAILEAVDDGINVNDAEGRYVLVNPATARRVGLPADQVIGKTPWDLYDPATARRIVDQYARVLRMGETVVEEVEFPGSTGPRFRQVRRIPLRDELGRIVGVVSSARDITQRKLAEDELLRSETILGQAGEMAHVGAWRIEAADREDLIAGSLFWSDEVYRIFGYEPGSIEITNDLFFRHVHPDDRQKVSDAVSGAIADRQQYTVEHRIIRPDGTERIVLEHAHFTFGEGSKSVQVIGAVQDITDFKRAEAERERLLEQLTEANARLTATSMLAQERAQAEQEARELAERAVKARDDFMSNAAHELKTPVTSLMGYAQLLMRQYEKAASLDAAAILKAMSVIDQQSRRLARLTEQLLNLSRLEAGKLALARQDTDVALLIENVADIVRQSHPERDIEVRAGRPVLASIDPLRIEQVIVNLVDNSLKFSPRGSLVEIDVTEDGGWACISVRDHGIGIPKDQQTHIFERFFQAHEERHYGGMGIGLFISRQIVELHGGTISVEQPQGEGTVFTIRLPRALPS